MSDHAPAPPSPAPEDLSRPGTTQLLRENWGWAAAAIITLVVLYFLGPILMPFVIGAALAYLGDPLVDRLERLHLSRTMGVCVVFVVAAAIIAGVMLLLVPMIGSQVTIMINSIPSWLNWIQDKALPAMGLHLPPGVRLNIHGLTQLVEQNLGGAGSLAGAVLSRVGHSTTTVFAAVVDVLLTPIVAFYLLRDWDHLVARIDQLIPVHVHDRARLLAHETDNVLNSLIRGQLLVMIALAAVYSIGLTIVGLHVALLIGVAAGIVSFIPYLGFISGLLAAAIAIFVQTGEPLAVLWVVIVFGIGEFLESGVLTPKLIGDRIGVHPVAVIFAILAGGQLFGFIGVLVALPVAAILAVLARHARSSWLASPLFQGHSRHS
ncbi:MAG TPA: AI-2E family transporter [Nevskiaceae bacterium]|nr:AI-2E family transporter [Nevskiaceae bacterium]